MHNIKPVKNVERIIKILFVDDDSSFLDSTKIMLERLGYIVTSANGSREAISLMREYHDVFNSAFDVIITDYAMPEINGIEFAKIAGGYLVDLPIILFTGHLDLIDEMEIAESGIAKVISKPCKISKLDSIIKEVTNKKNK